MAKIKETENKKLNKDDHKGVNMAAKFTKVAGAMIMGTVAVVKNKDKLEDIAKVATKIVLKK